MKIPESNWTLLVFFQFFNIDIEIITSVEKNYDLMKVYLKLF